MVDCQKPMRENLHKMGLPTGDEGVSFFLYEASGLPMCFSLVFAKRSLARFCCGVCRAMAWEIL